MGCRPGSRSLTNGYIEAEKERLKGSEMEEKRGTRAYEMMETKLQEVVAGLGLPASPEPAREELEGKLQQL